MNKDQSSAGEQEPELSQGEKDLDDVSSQTDFMDFSVTELAEQLTRQDSVSVNTYIYMLSQWRAFILNELSWIIFVYTHMNVMNTNQSRPEKD